MQLRNGKDTSSEIMSRNNSFQKTYPVRTSASKLHKQARKQGGEALVRLTKYTLKHGRFLGTNKAGEDYEGRVVQSMARYEAMRQKRMNLFALVLPAGHGKTYLAEKYGLIDVDMLISAEEHDYFLARRQGILAGTDTWSGHNTEWYFRMNKTLDLVDYSRPVILLCHHEETAFELGAQILGGAVLANEEVFAKNIAKRDELSRHFSIMSRDSFKVSRFIPNVKFAQSNEEIEAFFLDLMNANQLPVACPWLYSTRYANPHYKTTVPMWILRGQRRDDDTVNIAELVKMFERGEIPKECVDYYVRGSYAVTQFDFGVTMFEWINELAKLPPHMNDIEEFDTTSDLAKIFPPRGAKEMSRANVTLRRLVQTFDIFSYDDAYQLAASHVNEPHVFVTGLLSHWKSLGQFTSAAHLIHPWYRVRFSKWTSLMKNLHSLIRTSRFLMNTEIREEERQALMYMDLLVGREDYVINEMSEVEKRGGGSYVSTHLSFDPDSRRFTRDQYRRDFAKALHMGHIRFRGDDAKKIDTKSFLEFYERRKSWLTKGSTVYNKMPARMKRYSAQVLDATYHLVKQIEGMHNKQSLFECHELWEVMQDLKLDDFNTTKTMIKYETGGKERVLLPGALGHFIVFTYVLYFAEKQGQVGSVRLNSTPDEDIRLYDRKMSSGIYRVLYDWADFNEQHSADEMAAVIQALEDNVMAPADYGLFTQAIIEGMYNMYLEDRDGVKHKIWRGLYSGWRGTTWVNSVLNFCYLNVALMSYKRMYNVDAVVYVDHGGDDVDLALSDATDLTRILRIMDYMLFNANAWKQMLSTRSEFFRNTITSQGVYASPTRALAGFVAGDWEGKGNATIPERVVSLLDQIGKLKRRGVNPEFCNGMAICSIGHWAKIKDGDEWLNLPDVIKHGRVEDGGLGLPDRDNRLWKLKDKVPPMTDDWFKIIIPDMKASRDYVKTIASDVEKFSMTLVKRQEMARKYAEAAFDLSKDVNYEYWKGLLSFKTSVIGYVDVIVPSIDNSLMEEFLNYTVEENFISQVHVGQKYAEMSGHLERDGIRLSKQEIVDIVTDHSVRLEAAEFTGDIYYRRLVPEFMAYKITWYCRDALNQGIADEDIAMDVFRTLCYMASQLFDHHA
nr:RNA-dependent RNA polymerase [Aspergillus terreus chrysovirus 1]